MPDRILYNVTFKVEEEIAARWFDRVTKKIIPDCMGQPGALDIRLHEILIESPDGDKSFALQLMLESASAVERIAKPFLNALILEIESQFSGRYVYFGTMMKTIYTSKNTDAIE